MSLNTIFEKNDRTTDDMESIVNVGVIDTNSTSSENEESDTNEYNSSETSSVISDTQIDGFVGVIIEKASVSLKNDTDPTLERTTRSGVGRNTYSVINWDPDDIDGCSSALVMACQKSDGSLNLEPHHFKIPVTVDETSPESDTIELSVFARIWKRLKGEQSDSEPQKRSALLCCFPWCFKENRVGLRPSKSEHEDELLEQFYKSKSTHG